MNSINFGVQHCQMLREACHLASQNVDEAMKLENKGLIAQLVCVSLPLKSQREFGC